MSVLERHRELLDLKQSIPPDVDAALDRFLIAKQIIAHYSLMANLCSNGHASRAKRIKEISQAKQQMIDELRYLKFQEDMLDNEIQKIIRLFTANDA